MGGDGEEAASGEVVHGFDYSEKAAELAGLAGQAEMAWWFSLKWPPSGAEALTHFGLLVARLKPCPFKTDSN